MTEVLPFQVQVAHLSVGPMNVLRVPWGVSVCHMHVFVLVTVQRW